MDESTNSMVMPVAPMYGGGYGNGGGFGFGGDWSWILLLILLCNGGWGGFGGFGGGMMPFMMGAADGGFGLYPWLNNSEHISDGFRDQMLGTQVASIGDKITSGFGDVALGIAGVNQNICQTGNGITAAITGVQSAISQQLFGNEIASLNRSFAEQTANTAGFTGVNSGLADLKYTVATEACNDRAALSQGIQTVLDKLCALELDGYKRENDQLRTQLNMASLRESQTAQNAFISQGFANEVDALYNRLNTCPVPTTPVYGRTPIFTCGGNSGCGCGGNGFVN